MQQQLRVKQEQKDPTEKLLSVQHQERARPYSQPAIFHTLLESTQVLLQMQFMHSMAG